MSFEEALSTWSNINQWLREDVTEEDCEKILALEKRTKARFLFMHRIHGKLNKLRADRERRELLIKAGNAGRK